MALPKRVKQGGSYYKGYMLTVNAAVGDYVLHVSFASARVVNSISLVPDAYGIGDYFTVAHYKDISAGALVDTLGDTIYNAGGGVSYQLNLPALEPLDPNEDLRVTYSNVGGVAVNVYVLVEFVR